MNIHSFLGPFIETNERYLTSIFCSTHFYHLLVLANVPCEIKKIAKYDNKLKISTLEFTTTITLNYIWNSNTEENFSEMTCYF